MKMMQLQALREAVGALEHRLREGGHAYDRVLAAVHPDYRVSARNFLHYVALRQTDLRELQLGLIGHGLSSLGRSEGHVLDAVTSVRERLDDALARGATAAPASPADSGPTWEESNQLLHAHTRALLGPRPTHRHVYVMVTAPAAAEVDIVWVERLLAAGMNVLRVNTAHEDEAAWTHVVTTARHVAEARRAQLRIAVDLPGPKLRTVMPREGPRVAKWKPVRDDFGRVVTPCRIALVRRGHEPVAETHVIPVPDSLWPQLAIGAELAFRDARGKARRLKVIACDDDGVVAELGRTAYVVPGTVLTLRHDGHTRGEIQLDTIPPRRQRLALATGERFWLVKRGVEPPAGAKAIGCTVDDALDSLKPEQRVLFDDGHLEAVVDEVAPGQVALRVGYAAGGSFKLGGEKGINLPDTELALPLFSADDERALRFAARHADIVDASFVRNPGDVHELHRRLAELEADRIGLVLKIETGRAFRRLPAMLLAALERAPIGVMIARGDLAIESGYERLAELQEEMLWLCEAAHVPVIWATEVLDQLARTGRPSRAEVTDAAMAVRAECVMLNKGPYVAEAVGALDDILRRMEKHQYKKHSLYRRLHVQLDP
jgi:pyruvate kinase